LLTQLQDIIIVSVLKTACWDMAPDAHTPFYAVKGASKAYHVTARKTQGNPDDSQAHLLIKQ
jgi:hypothetical protein